ncbi:MAG: polysaccharide deacetylase family protein [Propionivibrio sp.]|uniref:Polysaccharide deacetylase family protein n=1 Tax=Candidatus Propionivibrio dominans TaxID=2954373 RepID=A0A9D7FN31_9RHOO|nr:polysaccharide deacetylase family protein [Candidatus Propionivibrio dominans]
MRLVDILRRHGAKATFNLNAGLHDRHRQFGWIYESTEVSRLGWDEMKEVYQGFTVANHSHGTPGLELMERAAARREIAEGRDPPAAVFQGKRYQGLPIRSGSSNEDIVQLSCSPVTYTRGPLLTSVTRSPGRRRCSSRCHSRT